MNHSSAFQPSSPEEVRRVMLAELHQILGVVDEEIVTELAQLFLEDIPPQLQAAGNALSASNRKQLQEIAHNLKGSSGNMGIRRFSHLCQELEDAARNGQALQAAQQLTQLQAEFKSVEQALQKYL